MDRYVMLGKMIDKGMLSSDTVLKGTESGIRDKLDGLVKRGQVLPTRDDFRAETRSDRRLMEICSRIGLTPEKFDEVSDRVIDSFMKEHADYKPTVSPLNPELAEKLKGVGRNDKCPCGSGHKFKKCHGR